MPRTDLFKASAPLPLAERLRPSTLNEVLGQPQLVGPGGRLTTMIERDTLASVILWGPPGVGKTTIARLLAEAAGFSFQGLSAVFSGVADLKRVFETARAQPRRTLLFVDEVHRFNRAQQDAFLPVIEDGTIILVGATTENPSFSLNGALVSRCQVLVLQRLDSATLEALLVRVEQAENLALPLTPEARHALCAMADGDGRYVLNLAEQVMKAGPEPLGPGALATLVQRRAPQHDRDRDGHYNLASALHKSLRGSDPDAALYWLARALAGGEDPGFLARRMVRFASEDIGLADPHALPQALAAWEAFERLGHPEGELALAQAALYLATAPKSNAAYTAYKQASQLAASTGSLPPPESILNAPTALMGALGYGAGYHYDHDAPDAFSGQNYFPDGIARPTLYDPAGRGYEREVARRLAHWATLRQERQQ